MTVVAAVAVVLLATAAMWTPLRSRQRGVVALSIIAIGCGAVIVIGSAIAAGGVIESDLGTWIQGQPLLFRITPAGCVAIALAAITAVARACDDVPLWRRTQLMVAFAACVVVASSGNLVVLTAGLGLLATAAFVQPLDAPLKHSWIGYFFVLAVIAMALASAQMQAHNGTTDLSAVPVGGISLALTSGLALLAVFFLAGLGRRRLIGRIGLPIGASLLAQLQQAVSPSDAALPLGFAYLGAAVAVAAATAAALGAADPRRVVTRAYVATAGVAICVAATPSAQARTVLFMTLGCAALWTLIAALDDHICVPRPRLGALLVATLVFGLGLDAHAMAATLIAGQDGVALAAGVWVAEGLLVIAASRQLWLLRRPAAESSRPQFWPVATALVGALAVASSLLPGWLADAIAHVFQTPSLASGPFALSFQLFWPGGVVYAALAITLAAVWSLLMLLDLSSSHRPRHAPDGRTGFTWNIRFLGAPVESAVATLRRTDTWLLTQPQFLIAAMAIAAGLWIFR